jgi:flagellar motor switch protein FliG
MKAVLGGTDKAAILLLALDSDIAARLVQSLDDFEVQEISQAMVSLGKVPAEVTEKIIMEFAQQMNETLSVIGNFSNTERFLRKVLSDEKVDSIIDELKGPIGKNVWDKLNNMQPRVLANFLKKEQAQTVALVLSKLQSVNAAKVISILSPDFANDVISKLLHMENVQKEILDNVEKTIRSNLISDPSRLGEYDNNYVVAEIFNNLDKASEERLMLLLEKQDRAAADKVRKLMFTFEDLVRIEANGMQQVIKILDMKKLAMALKDASEEVTAIFLQNMSQRSYGFLMDDIEGLGRVKNKDAEEARNYVVRIARDMIKAGIISLVDQEDSGDLG